MINASICCDAPNRCAGQHNGRGLARGWVNSVATSELIWIALLGVTSGLMVGCIGIGGVILVPALVFLGGIPIKIGIAAAMLAYILSGLVATTVFARHRSIRWDMAAWLCVGATPTCIRRRVGCQCRQPTVAGGGPWPINFSIGVQLAADAKLAPTGPSRAFPITRFWSSAPSRGFYRRSAAPAGRWCWCRSSSAMSVPVLVAVGLSQVIQLPVAIAATVGNVLYGELDSFWPASSRRR